MTETMTAPISRWLRVLRNPLIRIVLFVLMMLIISKAIRWLAPSHGMSMAQVLGLSGWPLCLAAIRQIVPAALAYWLLVRVIEGRQVSELAPHQFLKMTSTGWLVGMALMITTAAALALAGAYRIYGIHPDVYWLGPLVIVSIVPGIVEEIIFRGILFRVIEDGLGTWIALAISAAFFGAVHMANPNATMWSSAAIAIEAGLMIGLAFAWTRSLWFVMGLHAAWNFTQGSVLGIAVSGFDIKSWLNSKTYGPVWLSGGEFGAEASVLALLICLTITAFFMHKAQQAGHIKPPFWRRAKLATPITSVDPTQ